LGVAMPKSGEFHTKRSAILFLVSDVRIYSFKNVLVNITSSDGSCEVTNKLSSVSQDRAPSAIMINSPKIFMFFICIYLLFFNGYTSLNDTFWRVYGFYLESVVLF